LLFIAYIAYFDFEMPRVSEQSLLYIINHVFLPPKLPQKDDFNQSMEVDLLGMVLEALQKFLSFSVSQADADIINQTIGMMKTLVSVLDKTGALLETQLTQAMASLSQNGLFVLLRS
jgi:hypothetical protein